jgi:hypothetical protein
MANSIRKAIKDPKLRDTVMSLLSSGNWVVAVSSQAQAPRHTRDFQNYSKQRSGL